MELEKGKVLQESKPGEKSKEDSDVKKLQNELKKIGLYNGPIDGKFGPKTKEAVEKLQEAKGLNKDGKVGQKTAKAVNEEFENWPPPWVPNQKAKIALIKAKEDLGILIEFQEKADKLLKLCGGIAPIVLDYDELLKAKGYTEDKLRTALLCEQAMWWGYKKGIDKVGELAEALKPVLDIIPGLAELLKKGK